MKKANYQSILTKTIRLSVFVLIFLFGASCEQKQDPSQTQAECINLISGIINTDNTIVNSEIDKLTNGLSPNPTADDPLGHSANFETLLSRLNDCEQIHAELTCYGCIKTLPPISEILVKTDSSGIMIQRYIDFEANEQSNLKPIGIHN